MKQTIMIMWLITSLAYATDFDETLRLANEGSAEAEFELGQKYLLGEGVSENHKKALDGCIDRETGEKISKNKLKTYVDRKNCLKELFKSDEFVIRLGNETGVLKLNEVEQRKRMTRLSENTSKAFNKLLKAVELYEDKNGDKRSLYSIRHTYGTEMLEEGESLELVAKEMGNSSKVLDKYYNKVNVSSSAFTLSGKKAQQNFNNKDLEKLSRAELIKLLS